MGIDTSRLPSPLEAWKSLVLLRNNTCLKHLTGYAGKGIASILNWEEVRGLLQH
jgi:hypothetical protein